MLAYRILYVSEMCMWFVLLSHDMLLFLVFIALYREIFILGLGHSPVFAPKTLLRMLINNNNEFFSHDGPNSTIASAQKVEKQDRLLL